MPELTAPLVMKNDEKRIVYGPVLVPDEPDTDNDTVNAEKIEEVAHKFVEDYGNIDLQHSLNNVGKMIESYILPMDMPLDDEQVIPKGSWMLGVRVTDDDAWQSVKDNQLGGFSIMAIEKMSMKSANPSEKQEAQKRTTLEQLEEGWLVNAVSLVDEPAVPKAKYMAIKSKSKNKQVDISDETVQKAVQGSLEARERLVRHKVYSTFDSETTDSFVHSTFDNRVVIRVTDFLNNNERMLQLDYELDQSGNVTFTSEPKEVRIEESIVSVESGQGIATLSKDGNGFTSVNADSMQQGQLENQQSNGGQEESEGFMKRIKKMFGLNESSKQGRSVSEDNLQMLRTAKSNLDAVVSKGDNERSNKSKEGEEEMDEDKVQELVNKSVQPIQDQMNEVLNTLKGQNQQEDTSSSEGEGTENSNSDSSEKDSGSTQQEGNNNESNTSETSEKSNEEASNEEGAVAKSEYDKVVEELEKAKKKQPFSKRLAGQDNTAEKSEEESEPARDAFGFKRKEQ